MPSVLVLNAKRTRKLPGVRSPKPVEVRARRAIASLMAPMLADVAARLSGLDSMTRIADVILALREAQEVWERAFSWKAEGLAGRWALDVDVIGKEKLGRAVGKALGIDMAMILDAPDVAVSVRLASMEAADLIRKIPTDYIGRISRAVYQSMRQQPFPEGRTLAEEIRLIGGFAEERAQVIARDQTSKMNTNINQIRQTALGIQEYIWRTSEDSRVVGAPGGKYPQGNAMHGNHYVRNGKIFRWDEPPDDGHPGWPLQCRCVALGIVDRSQLREVAQVGKWSGPQTGWRLV